VHAVSLFRLRITSLIVVASLGLAVAPALRAQTVNTLEPIQYTFKVIDPDKHLAGIAARVPTGGRTTVTLMMPVWTPGYYVIEDYASRVRDLIARTPEGGELTISKPAPNRWEVATNGAPFFDLSYTLVAQGRSVTSNWVDAELGVINGGAAFITLAERARRPHDVRIEMPPMWKQSVSGLDAAPGGIPNQYRAPDFDALVDSPIVAGSLTIREFVAGGTTVVIADAGQQVSGTARRLVARLRSSSTKSEGSGASCRSSVTSF
jgi:predicted metalloprotease with PDZ domain